MQTIKRTVMPAKITFAGENTWIADISAKVPMKKYSCTYEANTLTKGGRKRTEDVNSWDEPS
jgi:hypothetical protein